MDTSAATIDPRIIIGYLGDGVTPIYLAAGASDDDDDDDLGIDPTGAGGGDDDDDGEPDEDEDGAGDDEKPKPKPAAPTGPTQDDINRLREAQAKRNREHRAELRALKAQITELKQAGQKTADGADEAHLKAIEDAATAAERKFKPVAIRNAAKAAFLEAGLNDLSDSRMNKLIRLLDMDDIGVTEDGEVIGLDDQVDGIKLDWPEMFRKPEPENKGKESGTPRIRAPKADPAGKSGAAPKPKTTGERYAARILGNS